VITNELYDRLDRIKLSTVTTYNSKREFVDTQKIASGDYDRFDNCLNQTIDIYDSATVFTAETLVERKTIESVYSGQVEGVDAVTMTARAQQSITHSINIRLKARPTIST